MERNLDKSYQNKLTRSCSDDLHYPSDPQLNFHDTSSYRVCYCQFQWLSKPPVKINEYVKIVEDYYDKSLIRATRCLIPLQIRAL